MKKHIAKLIISLLLSTSSLGLAAATSSFDKGISYFQKGDYQKALELFKKQEKAGDKSASLVYNIASSYFKLENYEQSKKYFSYLLRHSKMRGIAQYNLGLIAVKQGETRLAQAHFEEVKANTTNKKLKKLASDQLIKVKRAGHSWSAYASASYGHDDNITAAPTESALDESGSFYDIYLNADKVVSGKRHEGWLVEASYFRIDFSGGDNFDEYLYSVGGRYETRYNDWKLRTRLALDKNFFAGDDYQTSLKLEFSGRNKLSKNQYLGLRYRYQDVSSDKAIFDYLEGWRQRLRVDFKHYEKTHIYQLYYELELNERGILATTDYTYEYSPTRHKVLAKYTHILNPEVDLIAQMQYRQSDFPASTSFDRDDNQLKYTAGADYRLDKSTKIKAQVQYTDNESTVDRYDYNKTVIMIGINKLF